MVTGAAVAGPRTPECPGPFDTSARRN